MFANLMQLKSGFWCGALALLSVSVVASANVPSPIDWAAIPAPACPSVKGGGDGHSPDPLTVFNQFVELADGELYLLRGKVVLASSNESSSRRKVLPYFLVDLSAHPWLGGVKRNANPYYVIEGATSYWRGFNGSYGELAARARVQFKTDAEGEQIQVVSLKPIPELTLIPRRE